MTVFVCAGFMPDHRLLYLIIISGFFFGISNPLSTTLAMEVSPYLRSISLGAYNFSRWSGAALAPIVSGLIGQRWGMTVPFFIAAGILLLSWVWILLRGGLLQAVMAAKDQAAAGGHPDLSFQPEDRHNDDGREILGGIPMGKACAEAPSPMSARFFRQNLLIFALILGAVLNPLNSSTLSVALPVLIHHFHAPSSSITWVISAYYLVSAVAQPLIGALGDRYGYRPFIYIGLILISVVAILGPLSPNISVFIVSRAVQAFATSLIYPSAIGIGRQYLPEKKLGKLLGLIGMATGIAIAVGPPIGGLLLQQWGWPSIFWINVPLAAISLTILWSVLPKAAGTAPRSPRAIDLWGSMLFAVTIALSLIASNTPNAGDFWDLLVGATSSTVVFLWWEHKTTAPLLELHWLQKRQIALDFLLTIVTNWAMYLILYGVPSFTEIRLHLSAFNSGSLLLVFAGTMALFSPVGGKLAQHTARRKPLIVATFLLWIGSMVMWHWTTSIAGLMIALGFIGLSFAVINVLLQQILLESVPASESGRISGIFMFVRYIGTIAASVVTASSLVSPKAAHRLFVILVVLSTISVVLAWGIRDHSSRVASD